MPSWFYWLLLFLVFLFIIIAAAGSGYAYFKLREHVDKDETLIKQASNYIWYASFILFFIGMLIFIGSVIYIAMMNSITHYYSVSHKIYTGIISFLLIALTVIAGTLAVVANVKLSASSAFSDTYPEDQKIRFWINLTVGICFCISILLFSFFFVYSLTVDPIDCPKVIS